MLILSEYRQQELYLVCTFYRPLNRVDTRDTTNRCRIELFPKLSHIRLRPPVTENKHVRH